MAYDPDGRQLAIAYFSSNVVSIYDATDGGKQLSELSVGQSREQVVAWHPDGHRLAVSDSHNNIQLWDVGAGTKLATLTGHVQKVTALAFHPDGELLLSTSWDGVVRMWDAASGRPVMQVPLALLQLQFSEDKRWLGAALDGQQLQLLEVVPTRAYRTFVSSMGAGQGAYRDGDFSPDGRLLAVGMDDGARLWDVNIGRELAHLPGPTYSVFFQPNGRELRTCGFGGLNNWKIEQRRELPHGFQVGPAQPIPIPFVPVRAASSADGSAIAVVSEINGAAVMVNLPGGTATDVESVDKSVTFSHASACYVALSRNSRWLATAGWHSDRVRLWDARDGRLIHEWLVGRSQVFFTPDSRELIISRGEEFNFWDIESLQPIRRIHRDVALYPGHVGFSPDGRLMALEMAPGVIHLKDVATARTLARLEDPNGDRASWIGFTPNGTQLAVVAHYAKVVHTWDLRAIRADLKSMGLDWDCPPIAMAEPRKDGALPAEPIMRVKAHDSTSPHELPTH